MTVVAQRFKFLSQETNVGTIDILKNNTSDIFNSINSDVQQATSELKGLVSTAQASFDDAKQMVSSAVSSITSDITSALNIQADKIRSVKGIIGEMRDIASLTAKDLESIVAGYLPGNSLIQNAFKQLSSSCRNNAISYNGSGKPYDVSLSCNGRKQKTGKSSCNSGQFSDLINKTTGGAYNAVFNDYNKMLKNIVGLSKLGYSLNMCGVFSALAKDLPKDLLSRASGTLLSGLAASGNLTGVFDLAASTVGLSTLLEYPSGIPNVFNNFQLGGNFIENKFGEVADRLNGSMELLDDRWKTSGFDGSLSVANMAGFSGELDSVLRAKTMDNIYGLSSLDSIPDSDDLFSYAAYNSKSESPSSWFA